MKLHSLRLLVFCSVIVVSTLAAAQVATGAPPLGTFTAGPDVINLANLNVQYTIPVVNKPGRGIPFVYNLVYDSSIWFPVGNPGTQSWQHVDNWGWKPQGTAIVGYYNVHYWYTSCPQQTSSGYWYNIPYSEYIYDSYVDSTGTTHGMSATITDHNTPCNPNEPTSATAAASDGSGLTASISASGGVTVYTPDGTVIQPAINSGPVNGNTRTDSNGNQLTTNGTSFTDTLGTTPLTISGAAPNPQTYTYPTLVNGTPDTATVTVNYAPYTIQTWFQAPGIAEYGPFTQYLVTSIVYADNSHYSFAYEDTPAGAGCSGCKTGRIASVTLPTGGTISYNYWAGYNGILPDGRTSAFTRWTSDGYTNYSLSGSNTNVTDAQGNDSIHTFVNGLETHCDYYQGSSSSNVRLAYTDTFWNGSNTNFNPPITSNDTYWNWVIPGGSVIDRRTVTLYNSVGLPTEIDELDFPSAVTLLRKTVISYDGSLGGIVDRPHQVTVQDGGGNPVAQTTYSYDQPGLGSPAGGTRGNLTTVARWLNTSVDPVNTTFKYDDNGNVIQTTDPGGHQTSFTYGNNNAYVTLVTMPNTGVAHTTSATYDSNTGLMTSSTDQNGKVTNFTYDGMLRPLLTTFPDGGQTKIVYYTANDTFVQRKIDGTSSFGPPAIKITDYRVRYDGYGRPERTALYNGQAPNDWDMQDICYNSLGQVQYQSYPYQGSGFGQPKVCSGAVDSFTYDALGRSITVSHSDSSTAQASYSGNCVTTTDELLHLRQTCSDGLGRLTATWEPHETSGGLTYETAYKYDPLGNLIRIDQKGSGGTANWRTRTFSYDSLSRLLFATAPESGRTCYGTLDGGNNCLTNGYDSDSNLIYRTDARGVRTTYSYDALHRMTQKVYTDGTPTAHFRYDIDPGWGITLTNIIGRLTNTYTDAPTVGEIFGYDAVGRLVLNNQCTPANCGSSSWPVGYTYDLAGNLASYTNGAGTTFTQSTDGVGRPTQLTSNYIDSQHPGTLATIDPAVGYAAYGALRKIAFPNSLSETIAYNQRLQPCRINVNASGTILNQCDDAFPLKNIQDFNYGFSFGTANNGNVASVSAVGLENFNRTYGYDSMNRLQAMSAPTDTCRGLSWAYDPWGNRTDQNVTAGTCSTSHLGTMSVQNRLVGAPYQYDAAGNLTNDGAHTYSYDAENRLVSVDSGSTATYTYDAEGRRVKKTGGGVPQTTDYVYDQNGQVLAERLSTGWNAQYAYLNGQLIAIYKSGTTYFAHQDHLGSARLVTTLSGGIQESDDFLPYGERISTSVNPGVLSSSFELPKSVSNAGFEQTSTTLAGVQNPGFEQTSSISVQSPSFEGGLAQGWGLGYWGATAFVTNSQSYSGSYSLAQTGSIQGGSCQDVGGLVAGQSYQISVWVRADAGTTAQMYLWLHDTNGGNGSTTPLLTPGQSWQRVTATYVANGTGMVRIHLHYVPGAGTIYYDDVRVVVQNSSPSWSLGFWGATAFITAAQSHSGTYSLAHTGSVNGGSLQVITGLVSGQSYQASVWVRADAGTTAQMYLWLHDTTGGGQVTTSAITPGQSWQQVTLTFVATSTGQATLHLVYIPGAGTIYHDDVQMVRIAAPGWNVGYWGATASISSTQAHSGAYSLAHSGSTQGGSYQDIGGLASGQSYQVSLWVRADAGTTAQMYLWLHDTTGANSSSSSAITPGQTWQQVTLPYVADSTGQLRIHLHYVPGAGIIYYDDVQVVQNSSRGWYLAYGGINSVVTNTQSHSGGYSLAQSGATSGGSYEDVAGLIAGQSYQISAWVRSDAGTTAQMGLLLHDTTGANSSNTTPITPGQSWQQVTLNYVANSTGQIRIHLQYMPGSGTIYYDDVQVVRQGASSDVLTYKFSGDEHDSESNLEHTWFRQLSTTQGRWLTPDPYMGSMDPTNPQSLNRYAYVMNDPMDAVDPLGLTDCPQGKTCVPPPKLPPGNPGNGCAPGDATCGGDVFGARLFGTYIVVCDRWVGNSEGGDFVGCRRVNLGLPLLDRGQHGNRWHFTLGIRAPGQGYFSCLKQHVEDYSIAGVFGVENKVGKFLLGNDVASLAWGDRAEGAAGLGAVHGGLEGVATGIGKQITYGRRNSEIISLNVRLFGNAPRGPAMRALAGTARTGLETAGEWLTGAGELKLAIDVGLTAAEAINCTMHF
jgi:RHS repeat-associated protein